MTEEDIILISRADFELLSQAAAALAEHPTLEHHQGAVRGRKKLKQLAERARQRLAEQQAPPQESPATTHWLMDGNAARYMRLIIDGGAPLQLVPMLREAENGDFTDLVAACAAGAPCGDLLHRIAVLEAQLREVSIKGAD